ncbi:MAG: hypothetical protein ACXAC8_17650 [Candidatus Hodarchaeales archaeon]|jgi:hypothetical protein
MHLINLEIDDESYNWLLQLAEKKQVPFKEITQVITNQFSAYLCKLKTIFIVLEENNESTENLVERINKILEDRLQEWMKLHQIPNSLKKT